MEDLRENFSKRFQDLNGRQTQMSLRPSSVDVENVNHDYIQLELLDLESNEALHDAFQEKLLLEEKYPVLWNNARIWICQFAWTYCCE